MGQKFIIILDFITNLMSYIGNLLENVKKDKPSYVDTVGKIIAWYIFKILYKYKIKECRQMYCTPIVGSKI